jgi:hypothetical protein
MAAQKDPRRAPAPYLVGRATHFAWAGFPACGAPSALMTREPAEVNCRLCFRTKLWREAWAKLQKEGLAEEAGRRVADALAMIGKYGTIDGAHHKQWVLDQVVRVLLGGDPAAYAAWVARVRAGEDGPETYDWDAGIAP